MWNWLEIFGYIVIPICLIPIVVGLLIARYSKCIDSADAIGNSIGMGFCMAIVGFFACATVVADSKQTWTYFRTHEECKIISLENNPSVGGSFYRGTGNVQGNVTCSFCVEWPDGTMTVISAPTHNIIFHPNDEGVIKLYRGNNRQFYPRRISKTENSGPFGNNHVYEREWHIWIPRDKVNSYVKFN